MKNILLFFLFLGSVHAQDNGDFYGYTGSQWGAYSASEMGVSETSHNHSGVYEPANSNIQAHISSTANPHSVTKTQVGLGNVDNTSDADKPVSAATQTALDGKASSSHTHAHTDITDYDTELAGTTNTTAFTPTADYHPATKKYVDDNSGGSGNVNTSGSPVANDFARFTSSTEIEGRSYAETRSDLDLEINVDVQAYDANLPTWPSTVDATEVGHLNGVTSAIQTQIDGKASTSHNHAAGDVTSGTFADARISESSVTQHESALSIAESQITSQTRWHIIAISDISTAITTGDNKDNMEVPYTGDITTAHVRCDGAPTGSAATFDIRVNTTSLFTTVMTIDDGENSSRTAATAPVIDTSNDDVVPGDVLRFDIDGVGSTNAGTNCKVSVEFTL